MRGKYKIPCGKSSHTANIGSQSVSQPHRHTHTHTLNNEPNGETKIDRQRYKNTAKEQQKKNVYMIHNEIKFCAAWKTFGIFCVRILRSLCCTFFHIDSLVFTQRIYLISNKRTVFIIRPVCNFTVCCCSCVLLLELEFFFAFSCSFYFILISFCLWHGIDVLFGASRTLFRPFYCCAFVYLPSFVLFFECVISNGCISVRLRLFLFCFVFYFRGSFPQCIFFFSFQSAV